jgi:hypothetical protein
VLPAQECAPIPEESRYLAECRVRAVAATGSLNEAYVAFLAETAAAKGIPFFWKTPEIYNIETANYGGDVYLQVSVPKFGTDSNPRALAAQLLAKSGARAIVVTDADRGAYGMQRGKSRFLHMPAIPVPQAVQGSGAGDAHFAGVISAFLYCPRAIRLERAMAIGRVVAARHVSGLAPGGWGELRRFEEVFGTDPQMGAA